MGYEVVFPNGFYLMNEGTLVLSLVMEDIFMTEKQKKKKTQYQATYHVYQDSGEDTRSTKGLTDDEYFKLYEDDRMIFKEK